MNHPERLNGSLIELGHTSRQYPPVKEADRERFEYLHVGGAPEPRRGETRIRDYGQRRQLTLHPVTKTAALEAITDQYAVDPSTGEPRLTRLDTSIREQILGWPHERWKTSASPTWAVSRCECFDRDGTTG